MLLFFFVVYYSNNIIYKNYHIISFISYNRNKEKISVCIVDEATQCCEAESLIPLLLGVNTLIIVGDPNQLPATVISQV